jgi:putative transposase
MISDHVYQRHLPHWRKEGAVYFVTFRLADSIPRHLMDKWIDDHRTFMKAHGLEGDLPEPVRIQRYLAIPEKVRRAFEREQARRFFVELDRCHGSCALRNPEAAKLVVGPLEFHHGRTMHCGDFIVMPNHVHAILAPFPGKDLECLLQSVKRYSAVRINRLIGKGGKLWQKESYDRIIRDNTELHRIRAYIENNPTKAKLKPGEYYYQKAEWL